MAKQTHDQAEQVSQTTVESDETAGIPRRQEGEGLMEYAARMKSQAGILREQAAGNRKGSQNGQASSVIPRKTDEDAASDAWAEYHNQLISVSQLAERLHESGLWNEKEAQTVYWLSNKDGATPATQVQVATALGCNSWMVYNYRRDAMVKLAALVGGNWEDFHEELGIRRGAAKPERHTQYMPRVSDDEKARRKAVHDQEIARRKAERLSNKAKQDNAESPE